MHTRAWRERLVLWCLVNFCPRGTDACSVTQLRGAWGEHEPHTTVASFVFLFSQTYPTTLNAAYSRIIMAITFTGVLLLMSITGGREARDEARYCLSGSRRKFFPVMFPSTAAPEKHITYPALNRTLVQL